MRSLEIGPSEMHVLGTSLRGISFFADLSMRDLERMLSVTSLQGYENGEVIFRQGQVGDAFYVIYRGQVDILSPRFFLPSRKVARLGPGEFFGEMALLEQPYRTAKAVARGPAELFVLLATNFNDLLRDNPEFARALNEVAARRAFELRQKQSA